MEWQNFRTITVKLKMMVFRSHSQPGLCMGRKLVKSPRIMAEFSYAQSGNVLQWNKFMFDIFHPHPSLPPNIKAVSRHNPLKMEWPSVTLGLKFKSFLLLIHFHPHGNSHQEWFCCHYFQALTLVPMIWCCVHETQKGNEHRSYGMNSKNCQLIGWKSDTSQETCLLKYIF